MAAMQILLTGASGYVGSALLPRLVAEGHDVRGFARDPSRVRVDIPIVTGDAVTGVGLPDALRGIDVAYFLIHSMEPSRDGAFSERDRRAATNFARAAREAGVGRVIYLGGLVPERLRASPHLASRLEVERILLDSAPDAVALRASIVIGARSRSFRFLVRLVERVPVLPLPGWRDFRTQPIDGRDVIEYLAACATAPEVSGRSLDIVGPDVLTYGAMVERIADLMLVGRPAVRFGLIATPLASRIASAIAGETPELIRPLMEGLTSDLLPRDHSAQELLGVRLHSFGAAVEHALREWEETEPLRAR
jgi:uncharacterized protein YbjT (DUF2867 family)